MIGRLRTRVLLALPPLHASGNVWQLLLDGRGKGGGAACAGPFPLPFPSVGPGGRPLVGPVGVGSVPTDGEWECWPSLVQGE